MVNTQVEKDGKTIKERIKNIVRKVATKIAKTPLERYYLVINI